MKDIYVPLRNPSSSLGDAQFQLRAPGLWGTRTLLVLSLFTDLSTRQNLLWCKMSTRSLEYSSDKQERKTLLRPFHRTRLRLRLSRKETTTKGKATVVFWIYLIKPLYTPKICLLISFPLELTLLPSRLSSIAYWTFILKKSWRWYEELYGSNFGSCLKKEYYRV